VPALAYVEKFKQKHLAYSQPRLQRTRYRMSESLLFPASMTGRGILTIKPRPQHASNHPLIVDLQGDFNRLTSTKLKKRVKVYLKENTGNLAINFGGVTSAERRPLLMFLKRLRNDEARIRLVSIDSWQTDMADVVAYAKNYFQVFMDVECLTASFA
jgi:anti-anti-sigma regulatory factor